MHDVDPLSAALIESIRQNGLPIDLSQNTRFNRPSAGLMESIRQNGLPADLSRIPAALMEAIRADGLTADLGQNARYRILGNKRRTRKPKSAPLPRTSTRRPKLYRS